MKWVHDSDGRVNWTRLLVMLGFTVVTAYLSVRTQRAASDPDLMTTVRMGLARQRITAGIRLQQAGRVIEDAGWTAYKAARP